MKYCIYFLLKDGVLIYIGQTNDLQRRMYQHNDKDYDKMRFIPVGSRELAKHYEKRLISYFKPILNCTNVEPTVVMRIRISDVPAVDKLLKEYKEEKKRNRQNLLKKSNGK